MKNDFPPGFEGNNVIAIDFDGVIHNDNKGFHDGTIYGDPIEGSLEAIKRLALKYKIVIFTAKAKSDRPLIDGRGGKFLVWQWLFKHGIAECISEVTAEKPRAAIYIDDKGYRFEDWDSTIKFMDENFS